MRTTIIFFFSVFLHLSLGAQQEITVISGQVFYYEETGSKAILKYPGSQFELKGKLRCKGTESAKLVYNGHYFWVSGTKLRYVQDVVDAAVKTSDMSFTGRFFNFLTESIKEGESPADVKKYHRKYMGKSSGGIRGWAKKDYDIDALLLSSGKLLPANVIFKWRNTPGQGPYSFKLIGANGNTIAHLIVRDTAITLDLDQLALNLDEEYTWNVTRNDTLKSASVPFEICPSSVLDRQTDLSHEVAFKAASPMEQQLMLAYRLEEERCFYSANSTYFNLLAADPDNVLLRKMYATFLARMDMLPEASSVLSNTPK